MLRISELKLPLGHPPQAIETAIHQRLGLPGGDVLSWAVANQSWRLVTSSR